MATRRLLTRSSLTITTATTKQSTSSLFSRSHTSPTVYNTPPGPPPSPFESTSSFLLLLRPFLALATNLHCFSPTATNSRKFSTTSPPNGSSPYGSNRPPNSPNEGASRIESNNVLVERAMIQMEGRIQSKLGRKLERDELHQIVLLYQGKAVDHDGPMDIQQIAERFQIDVAQVQMILRSSSHPPETGSQLQKSVTPSRRNINLDNIKSEFLSRRIAYYSYLYSRSTDYAASPYQLSRRKKIKKVELPTHYLEVNYRTSKSVAFYGPNISHVHRVGKLENFFG